MTLSGATCPGQCRTGSDGSKGAPAFLKATALLEPHHQIVYCQVHGTR